MDLDYADELRSVTERAAEALLRLAPELAAERSGPGKWSIKEIVGHLIDSASNNHQRFVRAQWTPDLVFPGYTQDEWVASQHYADAPWPELVVLWREFNLHLARFMSAIPVHDRERPRQPHNLDQISFNPVPLDQPATLDYFMRDYVEHLKHHLRQISELTQRFTPAKSI